MIHRMIDSDSLPAHLYSVVDRNGHLTATPEALADTMLQHFTEVFALPEDPPPPPDPIPEMLWSKPGIDPRWYNGLMAPIDDAELVETAGQLPLITSPGEDQVSSGLWKMMMTDSPSLRALIGALFNGCLRLSFFPQCWKTSVIVPLVKDVHKERTMSNIRPISLQSCLGKILSRILARRLGRILAQHPILNPSQRGFINGGTTLKCIDEILDAWQWSRATTVHCLHSSMISSKPTTRSSRKPWQGHWSACGSRGPSSSSSSTASHSCHRACARPTVTPAASMCAAVCVKATPWRRSYSYC